eukprot:6142523-Heterocapsa_arctica.AAC.1
MALTYYPAEVANKEIRQVVDYRENQARHVAHRCRVVCSRQFQKHFATRCPISTCIAQGLAVQGFNKRGRT